MSQQQFDHFLTIWKWTVGLFATIMTIIAGILGVYMTSVNNRLDNLGARLDSIDRTLIEMNGKIERNTALLEAHINDENVHISRREREQG